jgi:hypothetical protein
MASAMSETEPRRIETSLLVVEGFTDRGGTEWRAGDRAPLNIPGRRRGRAGAKTQRRGT